MGSSQKSLVQIRELEFLDYDEKKALTNLDGDLLHSDVLIFEEKALEMKKEYLRNVVENQSFVTASKPQNTFNIVNEQ